MLLSINGPGVDDFKISPHITTWMNNSYGARKRHTKKRKNKENVKMKIVNQPNEIKLGNCRYHVIL